MTQHPNNPIASFGEILAQADKHPDIHEPTTFCLATVAADGKPSNRMLLLKDFGEHGFTFYTNSGSRKAQQLRENQSAAMCFFWQPLKKQIRIEGKVKAVDGTTADAYFASRPRDSRIGAWASIQSQPMIDMNELRTRVKAFEQRWQNQEVPRPDFWQGYCLSPELIEIWTEGQYRLHERVEYQLDSTGNWQHRMLFP